MSTKHNIIAKNHKFTLAGFEPGSSVLEADAMSTAPRRQGVRKYPLHFGLFAVIKFITCWLKTGCRQNKICSQPLFKDYVHTRVTR
jgi:hypothetical protein